MKKLRMNVSGLHVESFTVPEYAPHVGTVGAHRLNEGDSEASCSCPTLCAKAINTCGALQSCWCTDMSTCHPFQ